MSRLKANRPINNVRDMFIQGTPKIAPYPQMLKKTKPLGFSFPDPPSPLDFAQLSTASSTKLSLLARPRRANLFSSSSELREPNLVRNRSHVDVSNLLEIQDGLDDMDKRMM